MNTIDAASIKASLSKVLHILGTYAPALFIAFLVALYGYMAWQINSLSNVQPSSADVQAQLKVAGVPHIDQDVIEKIQQLQDNSVSVQALFDQARDNPFQE